MLDRAPCFTVEQNMRGCAAPNEGHEVSPSLPETEVLHNLKHVFPLYTIKGLCNIELDEQHRHFGVVKVLYRPLYILEVVMDRLTLDECALTMSDKLVQLWC
jgi:hypothetical protein